MAPRTILFIEDEPDLCTVFKDVFATADVDVIVAVSRQEVTQLAHTRPFDAILFDPMLPDWGGVEEVRELKRIFGSQTPVVIVAGYLGETMVAHARLAGADDLLTMPFDVDTILEAVLRLCQ